MTIKHISSQTVITNMKLDFFAIILNVCLYIYINPVIQWLYFKYLYKYTLQFKLYIVYCHYCNENDLFLHDDNGGKHVKLS